MTRQHITPRDIDDIIRGLFGTPEITQEEDKFQSLLIGQLQSLPPSSTMTNTKRIFVEQNSRTTLKEYAAEVSRSNILPQYLAAILGELHLISFNLITQISRVTSVEFQDNNFQGN